jgi:hypothetical protein
VIEFVDLIPLSIRSVQILFLSTGWKRERAPVQFQSEDTAANLKSAWRFKDSDNNNNVNTHWIRKSKMQGKTHPSSAGLFFRIRLFRRSGTFHFPGSTCTLE